MASTFAMWGLVTSYGQVAAMFQLQYEAAAFLAARTPDETPLTLKRIRSHEFLAGKDALYDRRTVVVQLDAEILATLPVDSLELIEREVWEEGYELNLERESYDAEEFADEQALATARLDKVQAILAARVRGEA